MKVTIAQLPHLIDRYGEKLKQLNEEEFSLRPAVNKWSKKEELGHLIDSAHNNLRRFIIAQYETNPKIVYEQDVWVRVSGYAHQSAYELIELWTLLNKQIYHVLQKMTSEVGERMCDAGKENTELRTLSWLAEDYLKHLLHHLHHILEMEPVAY